MGLGAVVYCNCWKEGRTSEPPVPREWIHVDDYEGSLWNSNPTRSSIPEHGTPEYAQMLEEDIAFDVWKLDGACSHPNMELVNVRVSNWSGVSGFRHALMMAGEAKFATVLAELPKGNGGIVSPEVAARMLEELDMFLTMGGYGCVTVLIDEETGEEVWEVAQGHRSMFQGSGDEKLTWNLDECGFVIIRIQEVSLIRRFGPIKLGFDRKMPGEVFRSRHFTQQPIGDGVEYRDIDTNVTFFSRMAINDQDPPISRRFRVGIKQQTPIEFAHEVEALKTVCRVSVASGNPVVWL